jgi:hypothetical protein
MLDHMTSSQCTSTCPHLRYLEPPHYLRAGLLVVFDGAAGSGKTTQLSRIRASQRSAGLFAGDPMFVELPRDLNNAEAVERRTAALEARAQGRAVFAERWHPDDPAPDVTLLSPVSFTHPTLSAMPPADRRPHVVVAEPGFESLVTSQLFGVLTSRGLMAGCSCGVAA